MTRPAATIAVARRTRFDVGFETMGYPIFFCPQARLEDWADAVRDNGITVDTDVDLEPFQRLPPTRGARPSSAPNAPARPSRSRIAIAESSGGRVSLSVHVQLTQFEATSSPGYHPVNMGTLSPHFVSSRLFDRLVRILSASGWRIFGPLRALDVLCTFNNDDFLSWSKMQIGESALATARCRTWRGP